MTETTLTETITFNGCDVTFETSIIDHVYTEVKVVKDGKQVICGPWGVNSRKFSPAAHEIIDPIVRRMELAVQGRTEESEAKRLAELEALLNLNDKDIVLDSVPDEEQQCRSDNRQRGQER